MTTTTTTTPADWRNAAADVKGTAHHIGSSAATRLAADYLRTGELTPADYVALVRWSEGRPSYVARLWADPAAEAAELAAQRDARRTAPAESTYVYVGKLAGGFPTMADDIANACSRRARGAVGDCMRPAHHAGAHCSAVGDAWHDITPGDVVTRNYDGARGVVIRIDQTPTFGDVYAVRLLADVAAESVDADGRPAYWQGRARAWSPVGPAEQSAELVATGARELITPAEAVAEAAEAEHIGRSYVAADGHTMIIRSTRTRNDGSVTPNYYDADHAPTCPCATSEDF